MKIYFLKGSNWIKSLLSLINGLNYIIIYQFKDTYFIIQVKIVM
jgi:hypothetical protein